MERQLKISGLRSEPERGERRAESGLKICGLRSEPEEGRRKAEKQLKITELRPAVRDPQRINLFVDGKFACSLDVAQVVELGVKVGQILTAERLAELKQASEFGKVYQRALEWALARPRSVRETQDYLRQRQMRRKQLNRRREQEEKRPLAEINETTMRLVVERLMERGYVDDRKFAEFMVESRQGRKGVSERKLRLELQRKGVGSELIEQVLATRPHDERAEIQRIIQKKGRRYDTPKLISYLVRQGFDYETVRSVVGEERGA